VVLSWQYDLRVSERVELLSTRANGVSDFRTQYVYDALDRMREITRYGEDTGVASMRVTFDFPNAQGNLDLTSMVVNRYIGRESTTPDVVSIYEYSPFTGELGSLTHTYGSNTIAFGFGYDNSGRITRFTSQDGTATYDYDETDQLTDVKYGPNRPENENYS